KGADDRRGAEGLQGGAGLPAGAVHRNPEPARRGRGRVLDRPGPQGRGRLPVPQQARPRGRRSRRVLQHLPVRRAVLSLLAGADHAPRLQKEFGFVNALAFDITNACAGTFTGIWLADMMLRLGLVQSALVVSGEYISHLTRTAQQEIEDFMDPRMAC